MQQNKNQPHSLETFGNFEPHEPPIKKPTILPFILAAIAVVVIVVLGFLAGLLIANEQDTDTTQNLPVPFNATIYLPRNNQYQNAVLYSDASDVSSSTFSFTKNVQFGAGLTAGAYKVTMYEDTDRFNPPDNCNIAPPATSTIPCTAYEADKSDDELYVYSGQRPGGIQNTSVGFYKSLYARKGNTIIIIEAADTEVATMYAYLRTLEPLSGDLPGDVTVITN